MSRYKMALMASLSCAALVGSGAPALAQSTAGKNDVVVVTAPNHPPVTAPFTESTVNHESIANVSAAPTVTAQTILTREPSVYAFTDGPFGVRTNVYLRAFNSSQFSETYDGVALNDVFNGGVTGSAENVNNVLVTPNNFDSVEIYRGINDPAVNSYNSLGGTVNYLPRQPAEKAGGEVGASYGSFNTLQWHATGNTGEVLGLRQMISLDHGSSDGWLKNTSDRNTNVYYAARYAGDNGNVLELHLISNQNNGYTPNNIPLPLIAQYGRDYQWPSNYEHHTIANKSDMVELSYDSQLASNVKFSNKFFLGYDDYQRTSYSNPALQQSASQPYYLDDSPNGFPFWLNTTNYPSGPNYDPTATFGSPQAGTAYHYYGYTAYGYGYTPTLTITLPNNELTLGGNITYGNLHSREYWYGTANMPKATGYNDAWDEHDTRTFASVYAQDRLALFDNRLHITGGLKFIYANTTDNDSVGFYYPLAGTVSDHESYVSPTIGVNYKIADGLSVYAAFGQNIKFPDISAFYGAFQTNSSGQNVIAPVKIQPEYVNDYEAGVKFEHGGFYASAALYREDFRNTFFTSTNAAGLSLTHNGGTSQYQGAELQLKQDFGNVVGGDLNGYFNYAYNQAKFTSSFASDYAGTVLAGQPLAGVPDQLISTGVVWKADGWRLNGDVRYVGRQYVDQYLAGLPGSTTISSYTRIDIGVSKIVEVRVAGHPTQMRFAFNVDNLFDAHYFNEAYSDTDFSGNSFLRVVNAAPRSFSGGVTISF